MTEYQLLIQISSQVEYQTYRTKYTQIELNNPIEVYFMEQQLRKIRINLIAINVQLLQGLTFEYQYTKSLKRQDLEIDLDIEKDVDDEIDTQQCYINIHPLFDLAHLQQFIEPPRNQTLSNLTELQHYFAPKFCLVFQKSDIETLVYLDQDMNNKIINDFTEEDEMEVTLAINICNYIIPLSKETQNIKINGSSESQNFMKISFDIDVEDEILTVFQNHNQIIDFDNVTKNIFIFQQIARDNMLQVLKETLVKEGLQLTETINKFKAEFALVKQYQPKSMKQRYYIRQLEVDEQYPSIHLLIAQYNDYQENSFQDICNNSNKIQLSSLTLRDVKNKQYLIADETQNIQVFILDDKFNYLADVTFPYQYKLNIQQKYGQTGILSISNQEIRSKYDIIRQAESFYQQSIIEEQSRRQNQRINLNQLIGQVPLQNKKLKRYHQDQLLKLLNLKSLQELDQYTQEGLQKTLCQILMNKLRQ